MVNTRLEAALQGIGDGARLEQLASDLLSREGYRVEPTGKRGPDGGRDALLYQDDERGILHCSVSENWEKKAHDDAEKADNRPEEFDFFIFATTQDPAGIKRDRVEEELKSEYGWRVRILDFERLRNQLMGNSENHDLAREHLSVNPSAAFEDAQKSADEFYEQCLNRLHNREGYYGTIRNQDEIFTGTPSSNESITRTDPPILAIHIIPAANFGNDHDRLGSELPAPPTFGRSRGGSEQYGDFVISGSSDGLYKDEPFTHYACFHEDGWAEAVMTHHCMAGTEKPTLSTCVDVCIADFIENALEWYSNVGIHPPFYTYVTLLDASEYSIYVPRDIWMASSRKMGTDEFRFGQATVEHFDADIPDLLRKPFYRLWNRAGWPRSLNYTEQENDETGEVTYEWDPQKNCI